MVAAGVCEYGECVQVNVCVCVHLMRLKVLCMYDK